MSASDTSPWASSRTRRQERPKDDSREGQRMTQEVRKGEEPKQKKMRVEEYSYYAQKQSTIRRSIGIKQVPNCNVVER